LYQTIIIIHEDCPVRVKSRWNVKGRERTPEEIAGALAFTAWKVGQQGCLNLENEGFETETQSRRLDVIAEFLAFLLHYLDRHLAEMGVDDTDREELVVLFAQDLARHMQENRADVEGSGEYKQAFIDLINERHGDYSDFVFDGKDPGFALCSQFGNHVAEKMGEHMNRWISDQVSAIEVPEALTPFRRALKNLLADMAQEEEGGEGGAKKPDAFSLQANNADE
jgi:hypothetical protein